MVLLLLGSIWMLLVLRTEARLSAQIESTQMHVDRLSQHRTKKLVNSSDRSASQQEIARANEILKQLSLPWNNLFQTLESTSTKDIALLSIQPDSNKQLVRISGQARNFAALLTYITRLEHSGILNHVYLTRHEVQTADPQKPINFSLIALWTAA